MSFGKSSSRSSSFGGQKKERRKKQEFHKHKVKLAEEEKLDFGALKERVVLSLTHLGKQQFSQQPGGYGFENWMKNFNLLLNDFEKRTGAQNLPKEYFDKRQEFTSALQRPSNGSELDSSILKLQAKEKVLGERLQKIGAKLTHERESTDRVAKIDALNVERAEELEHLQEERKRLAERKKEVEDSKRFFKRLFTGSRGNGTSISSIEARIHELEVKVESLDRRIAEHRAKHDSSGYRVLTEQELEQEFPKQYSELEEIKSELSELETRKINESENSELREHVAKSMSEIISKIELASKDSEVASPSIKTSV